MKYFLCELKRCVTSKFTMIVLFAMLLFLLLHIPYNQYQAVEYIKDKRVESYTTADTANSYYENAVKEDNEDDIEFFREEYEGYNLISQIYYSKDYESNLEVKENTEYKLILNEISYLKKSGWMPFAKSETVLKQNKRWHENIRENDIKTYPTPYDNNSLNFLYLLIHDNISIIILLLMSLSIIPVLVCADFEENTYKYLYTYNKRTKIMLHKFLIALITSFALLIISLGVIFMMTTLFFGTGTENYPYLLDNGMIIMVKDYIGQGLLVLSAVVFFLVSMVFCISYFCWKQVNAYTYFSLIIASTYVFLNYDISMAVHKYIPLFYIYMETIISKSTGCTPFMAMLFCIGYSIIMLTITIVCFTKRDLVTD